LTLDPLTQRTVYSRDQYVHKPQLFNCLCISDIELKSIMCLSCRFSSPVILTQWATHSQSLTPFWSKNSAITYTSRVKLNVASMNFLRLVRFSYCTQLSCAYLEIFDWIWFDLHSWVESFLCACFLWSSNHLLMFWETFLKKRELSMTVLSWSTTEVQYSTARSRSRWSMTTWLMLARKYVWGTPAMLSTSSWNCSRTRESPTNKMWLSRPVILAALNMHWRMSL